MDAQETQILTDLVNNLVGVVVAGGFAFITYYLKKHMSTIVALIDTNIGEKKFNQLVVFIKACISEAEKDGITKDLSGEAKKSQVIARVKDKYAGVLKDLNINDASLNTLVEGYWSGLADDLKDAYDDATKTEAQKKLAEAEASMKEAEKAKEEATVAQNNANAALATVQAKQAQLQAAIATVTTPTSNVTSEATSATTSEVASTSQSASVSESETK